MFYILSDFVSKYLGIFPTSHLTNKLSLITGLSHYCILIKTNHTITLHAITKKQYLIFSVNV